MGRVTRVWFALLGFAATSSSLSAQQSVYMLVDPIKGDQAAPHTLEFKLNSFSSDVQNSVTISSATGTAIGKASLNRVTVSMGFNAVASPSFNKSLAAGTRLPSIEVRFYNSTRMFYKTVFENVYLTRVLTEGSDTATQQIEFAYVRAKWFAPTDAAGLNTPVQIGCWDQSLNTSC